MMMENSQWPRTRTSIYLYRSDCFFSPHSCNFALSGYLRGETDLVIWAAERESLLTDSGSYN